MIPSLQMLEPPIVNFTERRVSQPINKNVKNKDNRMKNRFSLSRINVNMNGQALPTIPSTKKKTKGKHNKFNRTMRVDARSTKPLMCTIDQSSAIMEDTLEHMNTLEEIDLAKYASAAANLNNEELDEAESSNAQLVATSIDYATI